MRNHRLCLFAIVLSLFLATACSQNSGSSSDEQPTASRVGADAEREVDHFISTLEVERVDANAVLAGLKEVLKPHGELTETSLFASVWKPDSTPEIHCNDSSLSPAGVPSPVPSLILAFAIYRGNNQSAVTLRAYRLTNGHFVLADTAGDEFENYSLSTRQLRSSRPSPCDPARKAWFLMWGQSNTANGPNIRMRAYSFDGRKFKTVWMPENTWGNWTITVTDGGFVVEGLWYANGISRHDEYAVADDGFYRR